MLKSIEMTGTTRDIAIEKALELLQMDRDDVSVEVLDNGSKGFLGIGAKEAKVRVSYEVADELAPKPQPAPEAVKKQPAPKPAEAAPASVAPAPQDVPHLVKAAPQKEQEAQKKQPAPAAPLAQEKPRAERAERREKVEAAPVLPLAEEKITEPAREVIKFINGLLVQLKIEGKATLLSTTTPDHIQVNIEGEDMGPVIGRRGDTLDAIQYLSSLVINKFSEEHLRVTIDTENYRAKRMESLERLARKMAVKVCKYHKAMTLEPMNPYERRIIHAALQNFRGVSTHSTGTEPGRRIVISPEGASRAPRGDYKPRTRS